MPRVVLAYDVHLSHHLPSLAEAIQLAERDQLDQSVSKNRRFLRPGEHRFAGRIGRHLIQELVLRATTNDMDDIDRSAGHRLEHPEDVSIGQRQAFQNRSDDLSR